MSANDTPRTWLVIFDPTLKSVEGHSYNYDLAVAAEAKERFDHVVIYADEAFRAPAVPDIRFKEIPESHFLRMLRSAGRRAVPRNDSGALPNAPAARVPRSLQGFWKNLRARGLADSLARSLRLLETAPEDCVHVFLQQADLFEIAGELLLQEGEELG